MKKSIVAVAMLLTFLCGCASKPQTTNTVEDQYIESNEGNEDVKETSAVTKLSVVATIFPEYDWVKNIAGDNADVTLLLDNGVDLHSYQPTADDITKIINSDLFIYVGGESDEWVEDVYESAGNKNINSINLMEILSGNIKEEEVKEGMQSEEEADEAEEEAEYDEHVWLSFRNANIVCSAIADKLAEIDPNNEQIYRNNYKAYSEKLNDLDAKYESVTSAAGNKTLLFADRFPFRYMVDDYGLSYYAAFVGCSAETEASFETIAFLSSKLDSLGLKNVCIIDKNEDIARAVISNSNSPDTGIVILNSMQSTTGKEADKTSYIEIMTQNLPNLQKALEVR